ILIRGGAFAYPFNRLRATSKATAQAVIFEKLLIIGSTEDFLLVRNWSLASGNNFNYHDDDAAARVAVLGWSAAIELFGDTALAGQMIRINNVPFEVVGVLSQKGRAPDGSNQDDFILVPLSTLQKRLTRYYRADSVQSIYVKTAGDGMFQQAKEEITVTLRDQHRLTAIQEDDFTVRDPTALATVATNIAGTLTTLLGAVASISLVVGSIGIMNIMLVTVTERTREIGLRKAIGASERLLMLQFLLEAIMIAVIGGVIGVVLAVVGGMVAVVRWDTPFYIAPWAVLLALAVSAGVGIIAGYYPARKAALMTPMDALRQF
ncbi:MAG: ABC transporter permease, partial [Beijerinckiaceae bacterium]|nr:ABC transporter permease [Beijerinckiaceae bacterium]